MSCCVYTLLRCPQVATTWPGSWNIYHKYWTSIIRSKEWRPAHEHPEESAEKILVVTVTSSLICSSVRACRMFQDLKLKQLNGIQPSAVLPFKAKNGLLVYFLTHKKCLAIMRLFFIGLRLLKRPSLLHFWHRFKYFRMWFSSQQLLCIFSGCERMWDWEPAPVLFGNAGSQMLNKAQNCENMASHHFSI